MPSSGLASPSSKKQQERTEQQVRSGHQHTRQTLWECFDHAHEAENPTTSRFRWQQQLMQLEEGGDEALGA